MPPHRYTSTEPIFVDRDGPLARFAEAAADIPADGLRLLVFHGVGGQGKTALLRRIKELAEQEEQYPLLRTAMLDLQQVRPVDPIAMLVGIRNAFARPGVRFAAFDLTLANWWEASGQPGAFPNLACKNWLSRNKDDVAATGADAALSIADLLKEEASAIPLGPTLQRLGKWWIDREARRNLEIAQPDVKDLPSEPWQLAELLPWMLAQDLNHHLGEHPLERFLLLVDEYEGLFQGGDSGGYWRENGFDKHMRAFVAETDGLLAVFGSRRMLPWAEDPCWQANLAEADCPLEGLKDHDAQEWLARVPVEDATIAAAMLEGAREEKRPDALVYPLLLDLQVAHWLSLSDRGVPFGPENFRVDAQGFRGRCAELAGRLMRGFLDNDNLVRTIRRLCVANRFDKEAFGYVLERFKTGLPLDYFNDLPKLSFISQVEDGWLTMHRAVAEAIAETRPQEERLESAKALLAHFEGQATVESPHSISDDTVNALFEAAFLRQQLGAENYLPWLMNLTKPLQQSGRYHADEQLWRDAADFLDNEVGYWHPATAAALSNRAHNLDNLGRYAEAQQFHQKAYQIRQNIFRPFGPAWHLGSPAILQSLDNIAFNLDMQNKRQKARDFLDKSFSASKQFHGRHSTYFARACHNLGSHLDKYGNHVDAERYHQKALNICFKNSAYFDVSVAEIFGGMANNLKMQRKRISQSILFFENAICIMKVLIGDSSRSLAKYHFSQGECFFLARCYSSAEKSFDHAAQISEKFHEPDREFMFLAKIHLAHAVGRQNESQRAKKIFVKIFENFDPNQDEDRFYTAVANNFFAVTLENLSNYDEAESRYREAVRISERVLGRDARQTAVFKKDLNDFLKDRKKPL